MDYVDCYLMHWPSPVDPTDRSKLLPNWSIIDTWYVGASAWAAYYALMDNCVGQSCKSYLVRK